MGDYSKEEIKRIEEKWRTNWKERNVYKVENHSSKPKYYVLDMFPYPSGAGLHVGHPLGYIASDIVSRYKRLKGFNVLHPMGFDAFGLPAEQYAIQTGQHPRVTTEKNIATYIDQLSKIGFSYDWDRKVETCDPKYYKWTQWIFMQLFNSWYNKAAATVQSKIGGGKAEPIATLIAAFERNGNADVHAVCDEEVGRFTREDWNALNEKGRENLLQKYRLAYLAETMVNWCPALGTVLSNDEVKDGVSERGGYPVERKNMLQWNMRISAYAERLLNGLDTIDWPEPVREMQRNWIGKSVGCELDFYLAEGLTPALSAGEGVDAQYKSYATSEKAYWPILKKFSKDNRQNQTEAESILWEALRNNKLGYKIRRQHAIGIFIADFVCLDRRLVIEIDGEYHLKNKEYDIARTAFLKDEGFNVIRFNNEEVNSNLKQVLDQIKSALDNSPSIKESNSSLSSGEGRGEAIRVFTTRIDTIYGVTFMVIAPEHELVEKITTSEQREEVMKYVEIARNRSERERMSEVKRISGVFTGAYVINPFNNAKVPVWIADYVLAGYGTGAVMAVPSSDTRDFAFAKHFHLPIIDILEGPASDITKDNFDPKSGTMINSDFLNGLPWDEAIEKALEKVEELGIGLRKVNYRMRDAIFGRQRYWGEPFPVYYKDGIPRLVDEKDIPVTLPEIDAYKPTETGEPPLGRAKDWNYKGHPYELTTMPGWAGSSWYWFRYMDPHNDQEFCSKEIQSYWKDVDLYLGGSEHATGHLLYSRFWCKVLKDLGYVDAEEPFKKLINQGHIQGVSKLAYRVNGTNKFVSYNLRKDYEVTPLHVDVSFVEGDILNIEKFKNWRDDLKDIELILEEGKYVCGSEVDKMSKRYYNVVNPDDIVNNYGADTLRMYEMFLGPLELSKPWNTHGIDGVFKFLRRFWHLFHDNNGNLIVNQDEPVREELKVLHKTLKKIEHDIEHFSFNTSVSEFMICTHELSSMKCSKREILEPLVIALSPFAPHIAEELWEKLGHTESVFNTSFPAYKEEYLKENSFEYPISINGKVRAKINFALDMPREDIEKQVLASEAVLKWTDGKTPKKVIVVPGRIVNLVI